MRYSTCAINGSIQRYLLTRGRFHDTKNADQPPLNYYIAIFVFPSPVARAVANFRPSLKPTLKFTTSASRLSPGECLFGICRRSHNVNGLTGHHTPKRRRLSSLAQPPVTRSCLSRAGGLCPLFPLRRRTRSQGFCHQSAMAVSIGIGTEA